MRSRGYARRVERCVVNRAVIVYRVISSDLNNNINLVGSRVLEARFAFSVFDFARVARSLRGSNP